MFPKMISLLGLVACIVIAWLLSNNRARFPWRTVLSGLGLQFAFALFILKTGAGLAISGGVQNAVKRPGDFSDEGAAMAFAPLAKGEVPGKHPQQHPQVVRHGLKAPGPVPARGLLIDDPPTAAGRAAAAATGSPRAPCSAAR